MESSQGIIFDIQHFSLHDGPGVRSTVFFKGCPLSCWWCGNPESQGREPQLLYFKHLCTGCGGCVPLCPARAMTVDGEGGRLDREACTACGACVPACPRSARQLSGSIVSVARVCAEVRQHWRIFQTSGGGVTLSGGEVLSQPEFLHDLLKALHDEAGLHTCLDTCGMAPWPLLERVLPYVDMVLFDVKHMDGDIHKNATRAGNGPILANARKLAARGVPVLIRVPLIPGFNDTDENLSALGAFLRETALLEAEIMPYHTLGMNKYAALDKAYTFYTDAAPRVEAAVATLERYGVHVEVHGG